ncbi:unnamed protein product [Dicrocoelium dendriticum]|nr:unnamed protein product [Dicrocoelium dendriticum]
MVVSMWSTPMLHGLSVPEHDEVYPDSARMLLFRSYRNLPTATNSPRATRLSARPSLRSPVMRPAYLTSNYSPFAFQRSSSVRNTRSNHFGSVINLGEPSPVPSDETSIALSGTGNSFSRLDQPQLSWARSSHLRRERSTACSRIRNNLNRYSVDLLLPSLSGPNDHAPVTTLANSLCSHANLNTSDTEPAANPASHSNNNGSSLSIRAVSSWAQTHNQAEDSPSNPSMLQHNTSNELQPTSSTQERVHPNRPSRLIFMPEEPNSGYNARDSTQEGITQRASRLRPSHRQLTYRRAAFRQDSNDDLSPRIISASPMINISSSRPVDRPIHVRHPEMVVEQRVQIGSDAQSSVSGASSVEDLSTGVPITFSGPNEQQPPRSIIVTVKEDDNVAISRTQHTASTPMNTFKEATFDYNDWRLSCSGTRELWRRLLLTERFVDVYFYVGGTDIFSSGISSQMTSPDPGAPGGPTSMRHHVPQQNRLPLDAISRNGHSISPVRALSHTAGSTESIVSNAVCNPSSLDTEVTDSASDADEEVRIIIGHSKETNPSRSSACVSSPLLVLPSFQSCHSLAKDLTTFGTLHNLGNNNNDISQSQIPTSAHKHTSRSESSIHDRSHSVSIQSDVEETDTLMETVKQLKTIHVQARCTRFAAHRLVLSIASPVFEAMFYGPLASLDSQPMQPISEYHIPDIHPKAFQIMLLYMYTDELQLGEDLDIVFYVLYASKKYMLPQLGRQCVEHLKEHITAANVCTVLDRSMFFEEDDLTRRCWHVIDVLAPHVLTSPGLIKMEAARFKSLLKRDTLNCKEAEVFAAVRRWAEAECTRRGIGVSLTNQARVAAEFLYLVRFPTMTLNEFAENVAYSGFLSLEMVRDLFVHITQQPNASPICHNKSDHQLSTVFEAGKDSGLTTSRDHPKHGGACVRATDLFSFVPRVGPKLWRCSRFSRTGKHSVSSSLSNGHQHSLSFRAYLLSTRMTLPPVEADFRMWFCGYLTASRRSPDIWRWNVFRSTNIIYGFSRYRSKCW